MEIALLRPKARLVRRWGQAQFVFRGCGALETFAGSFDRNSETHDCAAGQSAVHPAHSLHYCRDKNVFPRRPAFSGAQVGQAASSRWLNFTWPRGINSGGSTRLLRCGSVKNAPGHPGRALARQPTFEHRMPLRGYPIGWSGRSGRYRIRITSGNQAEFSASCLLFDSFPISPWAASRVSRASSQDWCCLRHGDDETMGACLRPDIELNLRGPAGPGAPGAQPLAAPETRAVAGRAPPTNRPKPHWPLDSIRAILTVNSVGPGDKLLWCRRARVHQPRSALPMLALSKRASRHSSSESTAISGVKLLRRGLSIGGRQYPPP